MTNFYTKIERYGNDILWVGYEDGKRFYKKVKYKPTFYVDDRRSDGTAPEFVSLIGDKPIKPIQFETMKEGSEFVDRYKGVHNVTICGNLNYTAAFTYDHYPGEIKFDMSAINIFNFDIEVDISKKKPDMENADNEITSIAVKSSKSKHYHLFGTKDYDPEATITAIDPSLIQYHKCKSEQELLTKFVELWCSDYPDVVSGWNCELFDIAYVVKRIENILGMASVKRLSPWGHVRERTFEMFKKPQKTYVISGISIVDYMHAFKKFGYKYGTLQSYKLDNVANVVLGTKKLSYEEYGTLTELYDRNPQLYLDYNLYDTRLIEMFEEQAALLALTFTVAYKSGVNYNEAFGTVGVWDTTIFRALMEQGRVPFVKEVSGEAAGSISGGYVKDPQVGMKDWIVSFDLDSLYPHLMMQYNMSPETYQHNIRENTSQQQILDGGYKNNTEYAVAANGASFSKDRLGIIPQIINGYYSERAEIKKRMLAAESALEVATSLEEKTQFKKQITQLHNSQMSIKILMNGLYGSTANAYFIYYISDMAQAITSSGQLSVKWAAQYVNKYLNDTLKTSNVDYVAYADTDSIHVHLGPLVKEIFGTVDVEREVGEKFIDDVCKKKLEPLLTQCYEDLANVMGAYRNAMRMKREKICDKAIFIAKKRYVMSVLNSEGVRYDEPKVSVTGIDAARSTTPDVCKKKFFEAFKIIVTEGEQETQKFIRDFKQEFFDLPIEDISKVSGTNDVDGYADHNSVYKKACPIHIRGCLIMNKWIGDNGLVNRYPLIQSGDKIKFVYLKLPNPLKENIISFIDKPPAEIDIEKYINRELQFSKVFLDPIQNILDALGWSAEKLDTLESFFS